MGNDHDVIRLAAFEFEYEAYLLQIKLANLGIESWVTSDFDMGLTTAAGLSGAQVNIRKTDYDFAAEAMTYIDQIADVEELAPAWSCNCGVQVDEGFAICWSCGANNESAENTDLPE